MSETTVAPAKRWAELHLEVGDYVKGNVQKPIYMASTEQIEFLLIKFAQAHVQKALEAANNLSKEIDIIFAEGNPLLTVYPLDNIK